MRTKKFILSWQDVECIARVASDLGLVAIENKRSISPSITIQGSNSILLHNSCYLLQRDWIFGDIQTNEIEKASIREYGIQPRVNFIAIDISYYSINKLEESRLGWGELVFHDNWLKMPELEKRSAPANVLKCFNALVSRVTSQALCLPTSRGRWYLLKHALEMRRASGSAFPMSWMEEAYEAE